MEMHKIIDSFSVSSQISVSDIPDIKKAGIKSIICNRPNDESDNQPSFGEIATVAKIEGIVIVYIPLAKNKAPDNEIQLFSDALSELPTPVLAYCRSGMRSATLWSLSQLSSIKEEEIIRITQKAGYDVSSAIQVALGK